MKAKHWGESQFEELIRTEGPKFIQSLREQQLATGDQKSWNALDALINYLKDIADSLWDSKNAPKRMAA